MVSHEETSDSSGQPEDAQLRDLKAARVRVEAPLRVGQEAVHRRGQEDQGKAHDRPPGLQVSPKEETKESEGRLPLHHALSLRIHGSPQSRLVQPSILIEHGIIFIPLLYYLKSLSRKEILNLKDSPLNMFHENAL